jgi:hypothetical protein
MQSRKRTKGSYVKRAGAGTMISRGKGLAGTQGRAEESPASPFPIRAVQMAIEERAFSGLYPFMPTISPFEDKHEQCQGTIGQEESDDVATRRSG